MFTASPLAAWTVDSPPFGRDALFSLPPWNRLGGWAFVNAKRAWIDASDTGPITYRERRNRPASTYSFSGNRSLCQLLSYLKPISTISYSVRIVP
jgi:hypothetical protein